MEVKGVFGCMHAAGGLGGHNLGSEQRPHRRRQLVAGPDHIRRLLDAQSAPLREQGRAREGMSAREAAEIDALEGGRAGATECGPRSGAFLDLRPFMDRTPPSVRRGAPPAPSVSLNLLTRFIEVLLVIAAQGPSKPLDTVFAV